MIPDISEVKLVEATFGPSSLTTAVVTIGPEQYQMCCDASQNFWANEKPGRYGSGIGVTAEDRYKPVRTGLLGQMAFGIMTSTEVDLEYRRFGDQHDTILNGQTVDVKCAMKNYGKVLIYRVNEWGRTIPIDKDIYVAGYVESEDRKKCIATIVLVGYATKADVESAPTEQSRYGRHINSVIYFYSLKPIGCLCFVAN